MVIGVNCFLLKKRIGGMRQYFFRLFRELLAQDVQNTYVFFYFKHNEEELEQLGNDDWKRNGILISDQMDVLRHLEMLDLYFCPFSALWPRPLPIPCVVTLHDIQEKYFPEFFDEEAHWNRAYHYVASTKTADQVITVSEFSKRSIMRHHHVSGKKIRVAYNVAGPHFYSETPKSSGDGLELPARFIYYPANRWLHKNHDNLLKALRLLKTKMGLEIPCVLTGFDYENGYRLHEKIREYDLEKQVHSLGYLKPEQVRYLYLNAEMLCFPSLFEGFGMPPLEAMVMGCPVACSNTTSLPEVVGDAALLFSPEKPDEIAHCISKLWSDEALRKALVEKGKRRAELFSVKQLASAHTEAFLAARKSFRKYRYWFSKYLYEPSHRKKMMQIKSGR